MNLSPAGHDAMTTVYILAGFGGLVWIIVGLVRDLILGIQDARYRVHLDTADRIINTARNIPTWCIATDAGNDLRAQMLTLRAGHVATARTPFANAVEASLRDMGAGVSV